MIDVIISYLSRNDVTAELERFGIHKRGQDISGDVPKDEQAWPFPRTPDITDEETGRVYCRVRLPKSVVETVLSYNPLTFSVEWRSDVGGDEPHPVVDGEPSNVGVFA